MTPPDVDVRVADRRDPDALARALGGTAWDLTVDLLAYDADDVERLFAIPRFSPGRVALVSTGQVYLVAPDARAPFRESDAELPAMPEPEPGTRTHANWVYGMGKRRAERRLRELAAERSISALALRIPTVQGEEDGAATGRLWAWLERMLDGEPLVLPDGGTHWVRFVHSGDVARALVSLAERPEWPSMPALNVTQPDDVTAREFLGLVAEAAGRAVEMVDVPGEVLGELADDLPYMGRWWSRPDGSAATKALGLVTRAPREYLPDVVRAHLAARPPSHRSYANRAAELALLRERSFRP